MERWRRSGKFKRKKWRRRENAFQTFVSLNFQPLLWLLEICLVSARTSHGVRWEAVGAWIEKNRSFDIEQISSIQQPSNVCCNSAQVPCVNNNKITRNHRVNARCHWKLLHRRAHVHPPSPSAHAPRNSLTTFPYNIQISYWFSRRSKILALRCLRLIHQWTLQSHPATS